MTRQTTTSKCPWNIYYNDSDSIEIFSLWTSIFYYSIKTKCRQYDDETLELGSETLELGSETFFIISSGHKLWMRHTFTNSNLF